MQQRHVIECVQCARVIRAQGFLFDFESAVIQRQGFVIVAFVSVDFAYIVQSVGGGSVIRAHGFLCDFESAVLRATSLNLSIYFVLLTVMIKSDIGSVQCTLAMASDNTREKDGEMYTDIVTKVVLANTHSLPSEAKRATLSLPQWSTSGSVNHLTHGLSSMNASDPPPPISDRHQTSP